MITLIDVLSLVRLTALYISTIGFIFFLNTPVPDFRIVLALTGVISWLCMKLADKNGIVKYLPLLLCILFVVPFRGLAGLLSVVPVIILLVNNAVHGTWHTTYDMVLTGLKAGLPAYAVMMVFLLPGFGDISRYMVPHSLSYFVLFLTLSVFGLRILRNEDPAVLNIRYVLMNLGITAAVLVVALLLSSSFFMNLLAGGIWLVYRYLILPVLAAFAYAIMIIPYGLYLLIRWVLSLIHHDAPEVQEQESPAQLGAAVFEQFEQATGSNLMALIGRGIGIILFVLIAVILVKKFGGQLQRTAAPRAAVSREDIRPQKTRRRRLFGDAPESVIRRCYAQFLKLCGKHNIKVDGSLASDDISKQAVQYLNSPEPEELRKLWLPVRFGERPDGSDAEKAKELLKTIRKLYKA